jgi:hypothetical protein
MTSLDDAWRWYQSVKGQLKLTTRIAGKYWDLLPNKRDNHLSDLTPDLVVSNAEFVLGELDDLAIVVLFSVFEATVRTNVVEEIKVEVNRLSHPALRYAAQQAKEGIEEGSFFRVLEPFKLEGQADLVEQVNQVRRYRNWVAHGRRGGTKPPNVSPDVAYDRLSQFLLLLQRSQDRPASPPPK